MAKHKMTKACEISKETKEAVYERDGGRCVYCQSNKGLPNAHFIPRSHGGLGIEENILTLCPNCHHDFDNTDNRQHMKEYFRGYLKAKYHGWEEKNLYYRKGM